MGSGSAHPVCWSRMDIYLWIILIATAAGLVQGLSGFGGAALAMPLFTLLMDLQSSVVLVTLLILLIGGLNFLSLPQGNWHSCHLLRLLAAAPLGVIVGVLSLIVVPERILLLILGLLLVGQGTYELGRWAMPRVDGTRLSYPAGALSGWLAATVGVPGPPVILYAAFQGWTPLERKTLLVVFLMVIALLTAAGHALAGLTTQGTLLHFAAAAPALVLSTLLGIRIFERMGEAGQGRAVNMILVMVGLLLLFEAASR